MSTSSMSAGVSTGGMKASVMGASSMSAGRVRAGSMSTSTGRVVLVVSVENGLDLVDDARHVGVELKGNGVGSGKVVLGAEGW